MKGNNSNGLVNLTLGNDFFWSINVQAFSAGDNSTNKSYAFSSSYYSIFDSGTSHIIVPPSVFTGLIQALVIANGNPEY
jgi:hypothetical protein